MVMRDFLTAESIRRIPSCRVTGLDRIYITQGLALGSASSRQLLIGHMQRSQTSQSQVQPLGHLSGELYNTDYFLFRECFANKRVSGSVV